jgi:hypothetical protein
MDDYGVTIVLIYVGVFVATYIAVFVASLGS